MKKEYRQQAEKNLRLEFILTEISKDLQIKVEKEEIDKLIESVGDEKLRQKLNTPSERLIIKHNLAKRKTLDALLKM